MQENLAMNVFVGSLFIAIIGGSCPFLHHYLYVHYVQILPHQLMCPPGDCHVFNFRGNEELYSVLGCSVQVLRFIDRVLFFWDVLQLY